MRNYMQGVYIFSLLFIGQLCYSQTQLIETLRDSIATQQEQDEIKLKLFNEIAEAFVYVNMDSAYDYAKRAESLAIELDNEYHYLYAIQRIGVYYYYKRQLDTAFAIFNKGYKRAIKANLLERQASYLGSLGLVMYSRTQFDSALYYLEKAYQIDVELRDTLKILVRLNNLGGIYSLVDRPVDAIESFHKGLLLAKALNNKNRIAYIANNMSMIYQRYESDEEALYYAKLAYENLDSSDLGRQQLLVNIGEYYLKMDSLMLAERFYSKAVLDSTKGKSCQVAAAFVGLSDLNIRKKKMKEAQHYLNKASSFIKSCQDSFHVYNHAIIEGRLARLMGNYTQARLSLNRAERFRNKHMSTYLALEKEKSRLEESLGNYSEALKYSRIYSSEIEAYHKAKYNREVARAELRRNFEEEKHQLLEQQSEMRQSLEDDISAFEDLRVIWSIASAFFIITIVVLAVSANRRKKTAFHFRKLNDIINQQKENLQHKSEQLAISNDKIKELSEFRERLAAMAVHDMKGPLSTIIGLAEGVMTDRKQKLIRKAGQQMLNFLMDLLDIYKFEKANIALQLHMHSISKLIEEAKASVYYIAEDKGVTCEMDIPSDLRAPLDEGIVVRVLTNLLSNAVKYSQVNSKVRVKAEQIDTETGNKLLVSISDEGLGLSKEQLEHMFKPMDFRKDVYISKSTSTGIGLDFCKLAVHAHRGRIWAESKEGVGTKIFIEFPMVLDKELQQIHPKKQETSKTEISDKETYQALIKELQVFKIHQAGKILKVLHLLEDLGADPQWIAKLKATVYSANEEHYRELINKVLGDGF